MINNGSRLFCKQIRNPRNNRFSTVIKNYRVCWCVVLTSLVTGAKDHFPQQNGTGFLVLSCWPHAPCNIITTYQWISIWTAAEKDMMTRLNADLKRTTYATSFHSCLSCVYNCDDQSHLHIFPRSSNIRSLMHLFVFFTIYGYMWPVPSRLDSSVGRALQRYHRGSGFKSQSGLNFYRL